MELFYKKSTKVSPIDLFFTLTSMDIKTTQIPTTQTTAYIEQHNNKASISTTERALNEQKTALDQLEDTLRPHTHGEREGPVIQQAI